MSLRRLLFQPTRANRVLINLHGGGFTSDSGSLTESLPIANLTQTKVVSVIYRLAPEHPFPAPVEDVVAVCRELLKTYEPWNMAIYGSSAGAVLTPEVAVKIKQLGLLLPGALGIFSGGADFTQTGDSQQIYGVQGLSGHPDTRPKGVQWLAVYVGFTDPKNPVLSSFFAHLHGMANPVHDQYARHAVKRHNHTAPRLPARRSRRKPGRLRGSKSLLLVRPQSTGISRSRRNHG